MRAVANSNSCLNSLSAKQITYISVRVVSLKFMEHRRFSFYNLFLLLVLFTFAVSNAFAQKPESTLASLIQKGHFEQARAAAAQIVARDPNNAEAYAYRGFVEYIEGGKPEPAIKDLTKAIQMEPRNGTYAAFLAMATIEPESAKQYAEKAAQLLYEPTTALEFFSRGRMMLLLGKQVPALEDLTDAIKRAPDFAFAYSWRARIYSDRKEYSKAIDDLKKVMSINRRYLGINERLGDVYSWSGQNSDAIQAYTRALESETPTAIIYHNRGVVNRRAGKEVESYNDYSKAIELYTLDIAKDPQNAGKFFNRAVCYANKADFVLAAKDFTSAIDLKPEIPDGYYKRADAYERLGKLDLAKADRRKYTDLGGKDPTPQPPGNLYPDMAFDIALAKRGLERGYASISGIVCTQYGGNVYRAGGIEVFLYPVTPYLQAWYDLREKRANPKKSFWVYMNDDAFYAKASVKANDQGRFVFSDLKPGRYFLQAFHQFSSAHQGTELVAQDDYTDYVRNYRYSVGHNSRIEKFVDLKAEEDVKITMKAGKTLIDLKGCL